MWRRKLRQISVAAVIYLGIYYWLSWSDRGLAGGVFCSKKISSVFSKFSEEDQPVFELLDNLSLTEAQCTAAFPDLTKEVDDAVARGPFHLEQTNSLVQGRVKDGKMYIINWQRKGDLSKQMLDERTAALNQLYRAIVTSPGPLPDTIFSLNIRDTPFPASWSYALPADGTATEAGQFLMPHFSFWSWPLPFIGSMDRALFAIKAIEDAVPFRSKIPRAVWRGTPRFNNPTYSQDLRKRLLALTADKPWADVEALKWGTNAENASNALAIEDFCRYKYIIYTEGVTYSGRLPFHQACQSVVLTPPINWMLHTTHLVKPVFSGMLLSAEGAGTGHNRQERHPSSGLSTRSGAWTKFGVDEANMVFVASDWSDLEAIVAWLEEHPAVAEGIARRQRELFVDGGYFSPAAETCYWRALIRGWSKVVHSEGEGWEEKEGVRWEKFTLKSD